MHLAYTRPVPLQHPNVSPGCPGRANPRSLASVVTPSRSFFVWSVVNSPVGSRYNVDASYGIHLISAVQFRWHHDLYTSKQLECVAPQARGAAEHRRLAVLRNTAGSRGSGARLQRRYLIYELLGIYSVMHAVFGICATILLKFLRLFIYLFFIFTKHAYETDL